MVTISELEVADIELARRYHNRFTAQQRSLETVRSWYEETPALFLTAKTDADEVTGVTTGHRRTTTRAELAGIGVVPERRGKGLGSRLLERFEKNAAESGFERISLGSAGGRVDRFYARHGYEPTAILVRRSREAGPPDPDETDFEVLEETVDGDARKLYLAADRLDQDRLAAARAAFEDESAIYILEKSIEEPD